MGGQLVTPVVKVFVGRDVAGQRSEFRRQRLIDLSEHLTECPPMNADGEDERIRGAFKAPHGLPLDSQQQIAVGIGGKRSGGLAIVGLKPPRCVADHRPIRPPRQATRLETVEETIDGRGDVVVTRHRLTAIV